MELSLFEKNHQEQFSEEQKEKILELRELKKTIKKNLGSIINFNEKIIIPLTSKLEKEFSNIKECYLFHVLIGSSIELRECSCFDLEGENSIIKQLKNKYEENIQ